MQKSSFEFVIKECEKIEVFLVEFEADDLVKSYRIQKGKVWFWRTYVKYGTKSNWASLARSPKPYSKCHEVLVQKYSRRL